MAEKVTVNKKQLEALLEIIGDDEDGDLTVTPHGNWMDAQFLEVRRRESGSISLTGQTFVVDYVGGYHRMPPRR